MDEKENTRELVVVDVKRYKKVKNALKESEERYRQLFENVPIGIYRTTRDGRIVDANPALVRMLGYESFADLSSRNLEKEYSDLNNSRADFVKRLERDGEIIGLEAIWSKKDGSRIHVRENAKLTKTADGEVLFEGTVEDITANKQIEAAQKIRTQQLEILNRIICSGNLAESMVEMLEKILDCVIEPLAFDTAGIYMYKPEGKKVNLLAHRGMQKKFFLNDKYMSIDNLPFSRVLLHGQPVYVDHLRGTLPDLAKKWKWQMACSIPLVSKGRVVGAMNVASCSRSVFSPEEKSILELIGKEAGTLVSKLHTETALRESEKYYRTLIELSPDIIVVMDLDAKLLTVNQQFLKSGGYFFDEVIGVSAYDFISGLERILLESKTVDFIKKKHGSGSEYLFKKKDGQAIPLEVAASILYDDQGRPKGIIVIGRDITERKHNEEVLRQSEDTFRCTFEAIPDPAYIWTRQADDRLLLSKFNQAATQITKGKIKDFLGIEAEKLFADFPNFVKKIRLAMDKGERQFSEILYKYQTTDESKWLQVDYVKTAEDSVMVITKDVTERKWAESQREAALQELRESKALIDAVVENVPLMIFIKEATDLRFVIFNRAGEELLGHDRKSLLGKNNLDLFPAEQAAFFMAKDREVLDRGDDMLDIPEEPIMTAKKGQRLLHTRKVCIRGADGTTKYLLGISEDITERKEAEAKLLAYQEKLRALTSEMMLVEERERRRIASELHDQIGQNLALCKLKVAALEKNLGDDAMKSELAAVRRLLECSIQDARSLIFDLSPPVLYELGFAAALEWLAERIQEQFHVPVEFENRFGDPELDNDRQVILFQVVRELLVNVGKHSRASQAKVILSQEKPFLKIQVNDNGVGFDASQIFAPKKQNGGFGFFSMRERLNYLGGGLEVKSRSGQGSQIMLTVPQQGSGAMPKKENS
jgi:PAS domain S-box-containing protein